MKSPKPATDNRFKKYIKSYLWNRTMLKIWKMATGINFSMSRINSGHHNLHTYEMSLKSDNDEFVQNCGGHFENGDRYKFFDVGNQCRDIIIYPHIKQCWIFTAHFLCHVLADISKILKPRIDPLMVTYYYVKSYFSIIIHLEVINIKVRNFYFPHRIL